MKVRFQVINKGEKVVDTVLQCRNRFAAMHELLDAHDVQYNPSKLQERGDWLNHYAGDDVLYRVSTRFG